MPLKQWLLGKGVQVKLSLQATPTFMVNIEPSSANGIANGMPVNNTVLQLAADANTTICKIEFYPAKRCDLINSQCVLWHIMAFWVGLAAMTGTRNSIHSYWHLAGTTSRTAKHAMACAPFALHFMY